MRIRVLMKDGTRYVGNPPDGLTDDSLLRIMQGQRVIAFEGMDGVRRIVNTDAIAVVEVLPAVEPEKAP